MNMKLNDVLKLYPFVFIAEISCFKDFYIIKQSEVISIEL